VRTKQTNRPDSGALALFACLRYEEATLANVTDFEERCDITDAERQIVLKWINKRMEDIKSKL
jgi:hypothetical protein